MSVSAEIQGFVDSSLHNDYPGVFLEVAVDSLITSSKLDVATMNRVFQGSELDPFQTALAVFSDYLPIFTQLICRLQEIKSNFLEIYRVVADNVPSCVDQFVASAVASLFAPDVLSGITPFLNGYLLLELIDAEDACPEQNCFSDSVVTGTLTTRLPSNLLETCRLVFVDTEDFSLRFLLEDLIDRFACAAFLHKTDELITNDYSNSYLQRLELYKEHIMIATWYSKINHISPTAQWKSSDFVYTTFYRVRKPELFRIMMDYPDSHPAIQDLNRLIKKTNHLQDIIISLSKEVCSRLLHPGVHTDEILMGYGCLVRALREVDPSSVAQDIICQPVTGCLRGREDAVHCIVDRLIAPPVSSSSSAEQQQREDEGETDGMGGGGGSSLQMELLLPTPLTVEPPDSDGDAHLVACDPNGDFGWVSSGAASENQEAVASSADWDNWMPDPLEALHHTAGPWKRRIDLLSLLVGIYGSKKAFLVEYRNLLSQRLLRQLSFDTAAQLRHLELLKLRFGEPDMQECEVMLKDIRDSRRITAYVSEANRDKTTAEDGSPSFSTQAFVLSGEYWPEFHREQFKLPADLETPFKEFTGCFEKMKGNRTLNWMHKLGLVNVTLEVGEQSISMDVSPLQASILHLFTQKPRWNLCDIGQHLEMTVSAVRRSLAPFLQRGILELLSGELEAYRVCSNAKGSPTNLPDETGGIDVSMAEQADIDAPDGQNGIPSGLQVYWSYIMGMLTNLGGLSLDRIHSMLRMFALSSSDGSECTKPQLRHFLEMKLKDGLLICDDNVYKLPPN